MPAIISSNQSVFLSGRLIIDIIVAYEALHSMKTRFQGKTRPMAVKLDTLNAYDRLEWQYPEIMMRKIGFNEQ